MAQTFSVAGAASIPLEDGGSVAPINLTTSFVFTSRADFSRSYASPVTDEAVNFGTLAVPGAKGVLVKCTAGSCSIKFNGGADAWPLAPGGAFYWSNPSQAFPNAALITAAANTTVIFLAVG